MLPSKQPKPLDVYSDPKVIASYLNADYLENPERRVTELLHDELPEIKMLDIAIGTGRTTRYFAPLVKEYVGIDFSAAMIDMCKKNNADKFSNAQFSVTDMRELKAFANYSFDFVLISYNAISAMNHRDRLKVFQEVHRVCKPGGHFFFSAHNLQCVDDLFGLAPLISKLSPLHPKQAYWRTREWFFRRFIYNPPTAYPAMKRNGRAVLNDGAHEGRLQHYYVKPTEQVDQLKVNFQNIRVFKRSGVEVISPAELPTITDGWLFYFCTNRKL